MQEERVLVRYSWRMQHLEYWQYSFWIYLKNCSKGRSIKNPLGALPIGAVSSWCLLLSSLVDMRTFYRANWDRNTAFSCNLTPSVSPMTKSTGFATTGRAIIFRVEVNYEMMTLFRYGSRGSFSVSLPQIQLSSLFRSIFYSRYFVKVESKIYIFPRDFERSPNTSS